MQDTRTQTTSTYKNAKNVAFTRAPAAWARDTQGGQGLLGSSGDALCSGLIWD